MVIFNEVSSIDSNHIFVVLNQNHHIERDGLVEGKTRSSRFFILPTIIATSVSRYDAAVTSDVKLKGNVRTVLLATLKAHRESLIISEWNSTYVNHHANPYASTDIVGKWYSRVVNTFQGV